MLITCFQCRQSLEAPEDSAGKRVRCPHCEYVIVVPSKPRLAETAAGSEPANVPVLALPNLDLDGEGEKAAATKIQPAPLPAPEPTVLPPLQPAAEEDRPRSRPRSRDEEFPETPSIDRSRRRRAPSATPSSGVRWGPMLAIGGILGVVLLIIIGVIVSNGASRQRNQVAKKNGFINPPMPPQVQMPPPRFEMPPAFIPAPQLVWREISRRERRFKAVFPAEPMEVNQNVNLVAMMAHEARVGDWYFCVAHRTLQEKDYQSVPVAERFQILQRSIATQLGSAMGADVPIFLNGTHPGREWAFNQFNGNWQFVRTYYVREDNQYHHYVLTARGPPNTFRNHFEIDHFFNSFNVLTGIEGGNTHIGEIVFQEFDEINQGGRRDNEFTALALHPKLDRVLVASLPWRLAVVAKAPANAPGNLLDQALLPKKARIKQIAYSSDGQWVAVNAGGEIQISTEINNGFNINQPAVPGVYCAYTKANRLLIATKDHIKEYDPATSKTLRTLKVADLDVLGFALSADEETLAVWGDKAIQVYSWPGQKLLGRIEAHAGPITKAAFSPDGSTLASAGVDRTIKLWNVETHEEEAALKEHAWTVADLAFAPDGKQLVSAGLDGLLIVWDIQADTPQPIWAQAHQFPVRTVVFSEDGKHLYLTCKHPGPPDRPAGKQYLRQLRKIPWASVKADPKQAQRIIAQQAGWHVPTTSVMSFLSADGKTLVTTTDGIDNFQQASSLRVWDAAAGTLKHAQGMKNVGTLSPDGKWFVLAKPGIQNLIQLLDVQNNRLYETGIDYVGAGFPTMFFAADSASFWMVRGNELIRYEVQTPPKQKPSLARRQVIELKKFNDTNTVQVLPSLDGKTFVVERSTVDTFLKTRTLHSSSTGATLPMPKLEPGQWSEHLRMRRFVGAGLEVHDYLTGNGQVIGQQRAMLGAHAVHPDKKYAATAESTGNQTVRLTLWDLQERRPLLTLPERARSLASVRFSPDGRFLAMVTGDSWTRVVPLDWLIAHKNGLPCNLADVTGP